MGKTAQLLDHPGVGRGLGNMRGYGVRRTTKKLVSAGNLMPSNISGNFFGDQALHVGNNKSRIAVCLQAIHADRRRTEQSIAHCFGSTRGSSCVHTLMHPLALQYSFVGYTSQPSSFKSPGPHFHVQHGFRQLYRTPRYSCSTRVEIWRKRVAP